MLALTVLVIAEILSPPPTVGGADPQTGAWIAFASVLVMLAGTVLSMGRVSFSFAIEGREPRHRVAAVDHRPPTTEAGAPVPRERRRHRRDRGAPRGRRAARWEEALMAETRELSFELERFEWAADDRLEVSGRWQGLTGRKLARPVLTVEADGRRRRLTALPGGQLPGKGGEAWRASFAWPHGPADVESAELEIGRSVVVDLPAPRRRKRRAARERSRTREEGLRSELAELREQIAELRAARGGSPEAEAVAESAEAVAESAEADRPSGERSRPSCAERLRGRARRLRERARAGDASATRCARSSRTSAPSTTRSATSTRR